MRKKANHYHKYKKMTLGKDYLVYQCQLPGCPHYISARLIANKIAMCYRCNKPFVVSPDMVRKGEEMLKLHCKDCTKTRKVAKPNANADDLLKALGFIGETEQL